MCQTLFGLKCNKLDKHCLWNSLFLVNQNICNYKKLFLRNSSENADELNGDS